MPKQGYVYIATDEDLPGFCKVGQTIDVEQRERTLNGGKMTATIKIAGSVWVDDMDIVEQAFHKILNHRRRDRGEWFNIEKDDVLPMLECVAKPAERPARLESSPTDRVGKPGGWHEAGWDMHCGGKTQAEIAEKFSVTQGAVIAMKRKMRRAGRGNEEKKRLQASHARVGNKGKRRSGPTPQSAFHEPIVDVLKELGGSGRAKDVIERVGQRMEGQLSRADRKLRKKNGQIEWVYNVRRARHKLKTEGILKSNSPHGLWELA